MEIECEIDSHCFIGARRGKTREEDRSLVDFKEIVTEKDIEDILFVISADMLTKFTPLNK